jgi:hypothetical protein
MNGLTVDNNEVGYEHGEDDGDCLKDAKVKGEVEAHTPAGMRKS